jgi:hypothetical protein
MVFPLLYNTPSCDVYALLSAATFIAVRLEQSEKAKFPMLVTPFGMVTLVRLEQLEKAEFPMLVTPFGMVKETPVFLAGYLYKMVLLLLYNTPSCDVYALLSAPTFIAVSSLQPLKAVELMLVTLFGMFTLIRLQSEKAWFPMLVTLFGIVMPVRL